MFSSAKLALIGSFSLMIFLSLGSLSSCGVPLCVGSFGDCEGMNKPATTVKAAQPGGQLTLLASTNRVEFGGEVRFRATGGTPDYRFEIVSGPAQDAGRIDQKTGVYYAPNYEGRVTVRVTDRVNASSEIWVQIGAPTPSSGAPTGPVTSAPAQPAPTSGSPGPETAPDSEAPWDSL